MSLSNVGYIGLGNIGAPAARRLIGKQFRAHVYDISTKAVQQLEKAGAVACETLPALAAPCRHIGICVRDEAQVQELLYGAQGLFAQCRPDTLIAIHSTVSRAAIVRWAQDAQKARLHIIDAAITGGAGGAQSGTLCYMVGGDKQLFERAKPVFATSGDRIIHAGATGAGMVLKLCNNLLTYSEFLAMSEATRLAEAAGLTAQLLREVGKSNGVVNETMFQFISTRNALAADSSEEDMEKMFGPFGRLAEKDLDCALQSATELGIHLPATKALRKSAHALFLNKA